MRDHDTLRKCLVVVGAVLLTGALAAAPAAAATPNSQASDVPAAVTLGGGWGGGHTF